MRAKGIAVAAIAALALAGCAQPNEEDAQATDSLLNLLSIQRMMLLDQETLSRELESAQRPAKLQEYIEGQFQPKIASLGSRTENAINPGAEPEARKVSTATSDLIDAGLQIEELLDAVDQLNEFPEINPSVVNYPTTALSDIEETAASTGAESLRIERQLLRSLSSSERSLAAIKSRLDELGELDDQTSEQISQSTELIERLKEETALAVSGFTISVEGALSEGISEIRSARAQALPEGACAQVNLPYPSTLGEPFTYAYPSPPIGCEEAMAAIVQLYEDADFRDTGEGWIEWGDPSLGTSTCSIDETIGYNAPRFVICLSDAFPPPSDDAPEDEQSPPGVLVFHAPATAG